MKKGYILTLLTVSFACLYASKGFAVAPVVTDPGDVIIGNNELNDAGVSGTFVFPTTINLDDIVADNATPDNEIKWSYSTSAPGTIEVNGTEALDPPGMVLGDDDPTSPRNSARIDRNNDPADGPDVGGDTYNDAGQSDNDNNTLTFRNVSSDTAGDASSSPTGDIGVSPVTVTLYASDCDTFTLQTILVYTRNKTSDSLTGALTETIVSTDDFPNEGAGTWTSRNLFQFGGTNTFVGAKGVATDLAGLCSAVSALGDNATQWQSPDEWLEISARTVYRVRYEMATNQGVADAQPLWFSIVANAHLAGHPTDPGFISWGSQRHRLDNTSGANAILDEGGVRATGLDAFDHWVYPTAGSTDQWNGDVVGVEGAFAAGAGTARDARVMFRIIDGGTAGAALNTDLDAGQVCLNTILVTSIPIQELVDLETPGGMEFPIDGTAHDNGFLALASTVTQDLGVSNANSWTLSVVNESVGGVGGASLRYDADAGGGTAANARLRRYPLVWNDDELLIQTAVIRSGVTGGLELGGEGGAPIDFINLTWSVPTNEIGGFDFSARGAIAGGRHDRAASPALIANTGGVAQPYIAFFDTHRATLDVSITDSKRVRGGIQLFGRDDVGTGVASDTVITESWEINRVALP